LIAHTEGRVAKPERRWGCRRGTPQGPSSSYFTQLSLVVCWSHDVLEENGWEDQDAAWQQGSLYWEWSRSPHGEWGDRWRSRFPMSLKYGIYGCHRIDFCV